MAKITNVYDLDEELDEEIREVIDDSFAFEKVVELSTELMKKYDISENVIGELFIDQIKRDYEM